MATVNGHERIVYVFRPGDLVGSRIFLPEQRGSRVRGRRDHPGPCDLHRSGGDSGHRARQSRDPARRDQPVRAATGAHHRTADGRDDRGRHGSALPAAPRLRGRGPRTILGVRPSSTPLRTKPARASWARPDRTRLVSWPSSRRRGSSSGAGALSWFDRRGWRRSRSSLEGRVGSRVTSWCNGRSSNRSSGVWASSRVWLLPHRRTPSTS